MPTENENKVDSLIDVGEADESSTEINLDNKGEPEKIETPAEEKIEIEQVPQDKTYENERETKLEKKDEVQEYSDCLLYTSPSPRDRTRSRMPSSA